MAGTNTTVRYRDQYTEWVNQTPINTEGRLFLFLVAQQGV